MNPSDYTLSPSTITKHEFALRVLLLAADGRESRGATLAKALRGRYARETHCFYLTPSRARKWELLYKAGFCARQRRCGHDYVWRFAHPFDLGRFLPLVDAVRRSEAILAGAPSAEVVFV